MSYENWKIAKSELEEKQEEYSAVAEWCNQNQTHHIEEIGDEYCVVANPVPTVEEQNEQIRQTRARLYATLVDSLHAQKDKDTIMGEWSEEKEQEYIAKVKELTIKIREENPYVELSVDNGTIYV